MIQKRIGAYLQQGKGGCESLLALRDTNCNKVFACQRQEKITPRNFTELVAVYGKHVMNKKPVLGLLV